MWTKKRSVILSLIFTRVFIGVAILAAAVLPFILFGGSSSDLAINFFGIYPEKGLLYIGMPPKTLLILVICIYSCFVPAMIALISLDMVLRNVKQGKVFIRNNVKYLRTISWCCFVIAIILLIGWPFISYIFVFAAAVAVFSGLLIRVFKNVIDAACEIQDENDFTI